MRLIGAVPVILAFMATGAQEGSRFGLVSGCVHRYVGTARWTDTTGQVRSAPVRWDMRILQVGTAAEVRLALVQGWVQDLAWYEPSRRPGFSLLLEYRRALYQIGFPDSATAADSLREFLRGAAAAVASSKPIVDSILVIGHWYGAAAGGGRVDNRYAWIVESSGSLSDREPWQGRASTPTWWRLVRRTLPDHEVMDFVPGIGITRYLYGHHGTVADAEISLATVNCGGN